MLYVGPIRYTLENWQIPHTPPPSGPVEAGRHPEEAGGARGQPRPRARHRYRRGHGGAQGPRCPLSEIMS